MSGSPSASNMSSSTVTPSPDAYARRPPNDPTLGFRYEDANIVTVFLTLSDGQAVGREMAQPDKFDDVVIRATDDQQRYEYYYRQLKHKQSDTKSITWDDLLDKSGPFALKAYYQSFLNTDWNAIGIIKELSIATNIGLVSLQYQSLTSPTTLHQAKNLKQKRLISDADAKKYFKITTPDEAIWKPITSGVKGTRYKLSSDGVKELTNVLSPSGANSDVVKFLDLLVFDVNQPNLEELEKINRSILRLYFPFLNDEAHDVFYNESKERILRLVGQVPHQTAGQQTGQTVSAEWAAVSKRCSLFNDIVNQVCKARVTLGSVPGYELNTLNRLNKQLHLNLANKKKLAKKSRWFPAWEHFLRTTSAWHSGARKNIQNLVTNNNTTMTALKLYKLLEDARLLDRSLFVRVNDEDGVESMRQHFEKLDDELQQFDSLSPERLCFAIELPSNTLKEELKRSVFDCLSGVAHLRKWILFVVISRQTIKGCDLTADDSPLKWKNLPDDAKRALASKTLKIGEHFNTNLTELGLDEIALGRSITPDILAWLALYDATTPLPVPLPKYDESLDEAYTNRFVRLPEFRPSDSMTRALSDRLVVTDESEYNGRVRKRQREKIYLFTPNDGNASSTSYRWSRRNIQTLDEMRKFVTPSKHSSIQVDEKYLLENDVCFGSGCDGKLAIVVDYAGKGKTTLLSSLSNHFLQGSLKQAKVAQMLFNISLTDQRMKQCSKQQGFGTGEEVVNVLLNMLFNGPQVSSDETHADGSLARHLIGAVCSNCTESRIVLMLDGFDEISESERGVVSELIEKLLDYVPGIRRIVLTSRPDNSLTEYLEERFQRFVLHLRDFTRQDQVEFLTAKWKRAIPDRDEGLIRKFAEHLAQSAGERVRDDESGSILGIPLQCLIFSECFLDALKQHLDTSDDDAAAAAMPQLDAGSFKVMRLYESFFNRKLDIFLGEKSRFVPDSSNSASVVLYGQSRAGIADALKRLAIFHLLKSVRDAERLARISWQVYSSEREGFQAGHLWSDVLTGAKLGVLRGCVARGEATDEAADRGRIAFIHRTFAEYLLALYIHDQFKMESSDVLDESGTSSTRQQCKVSRLLFETIFGESEFAGTMRFLDRLLEASLPAPIGEDGAVRCPFAAMRRERVVKQFPVLGHRVFNELAARLAIDTEDSSDIDNSSSDTGDEGDEGDESDESDEGGSRTTSASRHDDQDQDDNEADASTDEIGGLAEKTGETPHVVRWVLLCAKEHLIRSAPSRHRMRDVVAVNMAKSFCSILRNELRQGNVDEQQLAAMLQWFDAPRGWRDAKSFYFSFGFHACFVLFLQLGAPSKHLFHVLGAFARMLGLLLATAKRHERDKGLMWTLGAKITEILQDHMFGKCCSKTTCSDEHCYGRLQRVESYDAGIGVLLSVIDYKLLELDERAFLKQLFERFAQLVGSMQLHPGWTYSSLVVSSVRGPMPHAFLTVSNHLVDRLEAIGMLDEARQLVSFCTDTLVNTFVAVFDLLLRSTSAAHHSSFITLYLVLGPGLVAREGDARRRNAVLRAIFYTDDGVAFFTRFCLATGWSPSDSFLSDVFDKCPTYKGQRTQGIVTDWLEQVLLAIHATEGERGLVAFLGSIHPKAYSSPLIRSRIAYFVLKGGVLEQRTSQWLDKAFEALWNEHRASDFVEFLLEMPIEAHSSRWIQSYVQRLSPDAMTDYAVGISLMT